MKSERPIGKCHYCGKKGMHIIVQIDKKYDLCCFCGSKNIFEKHKDSLTDLRTQVNNLSVGENGMFQPKWKIEILKMINAKIEKLEEKK